MRLSEFLRSDSPVPIAAVPAFHALQSAAHRIFEKWPDIVVEPPEKDREKLVQDVNSRLIRNDWRDTKMSLVVAAARALFDADRRNRPDLADLRNFYFSEISTSTSQTFLSSMLSVYLGSFDPKSSHTQSLAKALESAAVRIGARGRMLIDALPDLLRPSAAPESIAREMLAVEDCWNGLKKIGIRTPHAPGLMDYAHLEFVRKISNDLTGKAALEKLFNWLKPEQLPRVSGADAAITAILQPWTRRDPPQTLLSYITENLVGLYGDPRVSHGGVWAGVPKDLLDGVLFRWLTGENIRFFLEAISVVEESHMFEPRRKFLLELHEEKRIDAAWVAFCDSAKDYAQQQAAKRGDQLLLKFGTQTARGNRKDTSLLILKIGDRIIVEGSHNFYIYIFKSNSKDVPRLYQNSYNCNEISEFDGWERKRHLGDWQGWVRERI